MPQKMSKIYTKFGRKQEQQCFFLRVDYGGRLKNAAFASKLPPYSSENVGPGRVKSIYLCAIPPSSAQCSSHIKKQQLLTRKPIVVCLDSKFPPTWFYGLCFFILFCLLSILRQLILPCTIKKK
mmetsp:Transcript_5869/g.12542  ORF Transcript_5869/g.12542 Transcript_5869/m.12542 type:complete len:124 (+) Transcript_5869:263-634(+)